MARFPLAAGMLFGVIPGLIRTVRCGPETGFRHERFSGSYPGVLFSLALVPVHLRVVVAPGSPHHPGILSFRSGSGSCQ